MNKGCKIIYVGLVPDTLVFLSKEEDIFLYAASYIEYLFSFRTWNPINYIFKLVYYLRVHKKYRFLELFFLRIFILFSFSSSSVAYKYKDYLKALSEKNISILDVNDKERAGSFIKDEKIDLMVVNSWWILSRSIIYLPTYKTINIHPSKLPQYKGSLPTLWSLKNKDKESAVTYLLLDEAIDGGGILSQYNFRIEENDNSISLEKKIELIVENTLIGDIKKYLEGTLSPRDQELALESSTAKYDEYRIIDWEKEDARDIFNKIILYPFIEPEVSCFFYLNNRMINLRGGELVKKIESPNSARPGTISLVGLKVLFNAKGGIIKSRLFIDLDFSDSIFVIKNRLK